VRQSETPRWVKAYYKRAHWFKGVERVLEAMYQAREGGVVAKSLAALTTFSAAMESLYPGENAWELLARQDYQESDYSLGGFFCNLLMRSNLPRTTRMAGLTSQMILWESAGGGIAAIYQGAVYQDGPFLQHGDRDHFERVLQEVVWGTGHDLMLSARPENPGNYRGSNKFRFSPMPPPGFYVGKNRPEDLAAWLGRFGRVPRTMLLRGPTGVGKSVLARHIAQQAKGTARTLKIADSMLKNCIFDEVDGLIEVLQPSVLLLDDVTFNEEADTERFLTMLEALRSPDCLVIATMMANTGGEQDKKPEQGGWYFPGMRPGRIDKILTLYLHDAEERNSILQSYYLEFGGMEDYPLWSRIVDATEGLSGAYLMEIARRLAVFGFDDWRDTVDELRRSAPPPGEGESRVLLPGASNVPVPR